MRHLVAPCGALLVLACIAAPVYAQGAVGYPSRPVRMIMPFAPGGAGDFVARILQVRMTELLGQQVIVDNRPGASGNIGVEVAANATPDGHTFLLGNIGAMAINPHVFPKFSVRPLRDFVAVTQVVDVPGTLVVHPTVPAKTVSELIGLLKARPGQLNYGSAGSGSQNRLETELFLSRTGTRMVHVPYKGGAGPAVTALLGNEVQVMLITFSSAVNHVKTGRLRMLGVIAPQRVPVMPDVPTMREQGFNDLTNGSWQGIYFPKGVAQAVTQKVFGVMVETMKHPDVVKRLSDGGVSVVVSASPAAFSAFNVAETERFGKLIRDAKIDIN